jgi:SAM-dependent methyltransferase
MATLRTSFQGVTNIVRFNWPFFGLAGLALTGFFALALWLPEPLRGYVVLFLAVAVTGTLIPLGVSWYVYDASGLYSLQWLDSLVKNSPKSMVNIHAGFDETSELLADRYPTATFHVFDFYDPSQHTEPSIRRARKAYPPYAGTQNIRTSYVPLPDASADVILLFFAAHEIRQDAERVLFFNELRRVLKPSGQVILVEHLRDIPNFLAYSLGFFHFLPFSAWRKTIRDSGFSLFQQHRLTPFIHVFSLVQA